MNRLIPMALAVGMLVGGCKREDDWRRLGRLSLECQAKTAPLDCKTRATPLERIECMIKLSEAQLEAPCSELQVVNQRLLAANHEGAWALYRSKCSEPDGEVCPKDPKSDLVRAHRAIVEKILSENKRAREAAKKFELRQPAGFFDAAWGSSPQRTAEVVLENLAPGESWDDVRAVAKGKPLSKSAPLVVRDKNGAQWMFWFDESNGLTSYTQDLVGKQTLADLFIVCRERFGTPTTQEKDSDGEELEWSGSRTTITCGKGPRMTVMKTQITKRSAKESGRDQ